MSNFHTALDELIPRLVCKARNNIFVAIALAPLPALVAHPSLAQISPLSLPVSALPQLEQDSRCPNWRPPISLQPSEFFSPFLSGDGNLLPLISTPLFTPTPPNFALPSPATLRAVLPRLKQNPNQLKLRRAIEVIHLLQQAELDNFFGEACLETQSVQVEEIDPKAAIIYTIILPDRLEIIVSLPHQPLKHYSTPVDKRTLETVLQSFREGLVTRSRRLFFQPGQQLYNWLVRPVLADLKPGEIETLVFVLDGPLRNVPMAALHDGNQFLIEQYAVAITPNPQLLAPQPLATRGIQTLAAGLTQARDRFPPLVFVEQELNTIQSQVAGTFLRDEKFTQENLRHQLMRHQFSVVHIATHGQFSSKEEETFLLTWDSRLGIRDLGEMIQAQEFLQRHPIELLILSACETATGNQEAALGMAGMAVRAGARSTLASLWAISDESTAVLMEEFYRNLNQPNVPKAKALQQAQIALLRSPRYQHPFYWSTFVLLGNWL